MTVPGSEHIKLGLRANFQQFALLVVINAFVGSMVGLEQTVLPLIGEAEFGLTSKIAILSFIASFGIVKALFNVFSGRLSESWGRKRVLVLGWAFGVPVPLLIIWAPSWFWINVANVLLGINQGLAWSMTVVMKVDLVGPKRRGLALGLNEFAGYLAVGLASLASGYIAAAYALRPHPFYIGVALAAIGLVLSAGLAKETRQFAVYEARSMSNSEAGKISFWRVFSLTSIRHRTLFSCSQAGLVNNLNHGMAWGLFPILFANFSLPVDSIGVIRAAYPAAWGILQLATGPVSDKAGRKWLIVPGMWMQAAGIWLTTSSTSFSGWFTGSLVMGIGTALVYPTLLAAVSDVAAPEWRATSLGVYRMWRDLGFAIGAVLSGVLADAFGMATSIWAIGWISIASGLMVMLLMSETLAKSILPTAKMYD